MEEFEKSVGYSPVVKELMRRQNVGGNSHDDGRKINNNSYFSKSFRNSKRKGAAILKNIKGVATSMSGLNKEQEHSFPEEQTAPPPPPKATSEWVKARQHGKSYKEFTALHMSQEILAHEGSIWAIRFSCDARFLASAGEDKVIHVWEVQECDVLSARSGDDLSSAGGTPVHPMAGIASDRPPLAEIIPMPSARKVVDWTDLHEMVTAASYTPDGQVAQMKFFKNKSWSDYWSRIGSREDQLGIFFIRHCSNCFELSKFELRQISSFASVSLELFASPS